MDLITAVLLKKFEEAKQSLLSKDTDVNRVIEEGFNALMLAAVSNDAKIVELLLEQKGIKTDEQEEKNQQTALMIASSLGGHKIVEMLLKKGVNKDIVNKRGLTALDIAEETIRKNKNPKNKNDYTKTIELLSESVLVC